LKRISAIVLAFLLVVGGLVSTKVLASILATFVGGTVTVVESGTLWLYVNSNDTSRMDWSEIGIQPYLDVVDHDLGEPNYVATDVGDALEGDFGFMDSGRSTETITSVTVQIYGLHATGNNLEVFVWDSSSWTSLGEQAFTSSWGWVNYTATTVLNTWAKIDAAKIYLKTSASGIYNVDCARLQVEYNSTG